MTIALIIGLTIFAIGTSLPEIMTCIVASIKKETEIAAGDIIGADILNILWIIGVSSTVKPITVEPKIIYFSFPFMILIVVTMLNSMRKSWKLDRIDGVFLIVLYVVFIILMVKLFGPQAAAH